MLFNSINTNKIIFIYEANKANKANKAHFIEPF